MYICSVQCVDLMYISFVKRFQRMNTSIASHSSLCVCVVRTASSRFQGYAPYYGPEPPAAAFVELARLLHLYKAGRMVTVVHHTVLDT